GGAGSQALARSDLNIRKPQDLGPASDTPGLIFTGSVGAVSPPDQLLTIVNRSRDMLKYVATFNPFDQELASRVTVTPARGTLSSFPDSGSIPQLTVRVNTANLPGPIYRGTINIQYVVDQNRGGYNRNVNVVVVLGNAGPTGAKEERLACAPSSLLPVFTSLEDRFAIASGDAVFTQTAIVDDCGNVASDLAVGGRF